MAAPEVKGRGHLFLMVIALDQKSSLDAFAENETP
jgi:hypothetical protein